MLAKKRIYKHIYPKEVDEQKVLAIWLSEYFNYYEWIHVPNERMAKVQHIRELQRMGMKRGFPDIIIFRDFNIKECDDFVTHYNGVTVELKRQVEGRLSDEQRKWLDEMRTKNKWYSFASAGAEKAIVKLKELYGIK